MQGEPGGARATTREERRRLREERRQARKERRRQRHDERREEAEGVAAAGEEAEEQQEEEVVVDLMWLRANLSSLWQEFRALARLQRSRAFHSQYGKGRAQAGREGGHRVHTHPGPPPQEEESEDTCPTDADGCRDAPGGAICNGRGACHCGHCQCEAEYYGSTCQCSDHTCQRYDGMPCGGPSRGQCRCGECMCRADYVGEACGCPTSTQSCIHPGQQAVCSNQGTCECGRCRCGDGYKGMYCEDSVYAARVCETLKACVLCKAWGRELTKCDQCQITISVVDMLEPSMTTCVMVNSGCILKYSYVAEATNAYSVLLERNNECPPLIE